MNDRASDEFELRVRTGEGITLDALTEPMLDDLLDAQAPPAEPYLEIERGSGQSIRARLLPDLVYQLSHHSEAGEFELYTSDPTLVRDILWAWVDEEPWWLDRVAWSPVDPAIAEIESMRQEMTGMLDGMSLLDDLGATMDDALARADELLEMDWEATDPDLS
ncbi:hypothetical protein [Nocardia sp. XZ_19_385]|uniref:hypothetical protein n=1 Tax=Nocardia sp. XZ_19_385 TaxID=2769488 RepID=UPI00189062C2|nr:hypothetical protein [Nocardia sp. XZ_19_385]